MPSSSAALAMYFRTAESGARSIGRHPSTSFLSVSAPALSSATAVSPVDLLVSLIIFRWRG